MISPMTRCTGSSQSEVLKMPPQLAVPALRPFDPGCMLNM
jgi:hypothetical protein